MNYKIIFSENASDDLNEIHDYISYKLRSPRNAQAQIERIIKEIRSLDQMPERYRRYDKAAWNNRNIRLFSVDNYCIVYTPDNEQRVVTILHIVYGGRDMDTVLAEYEGSVN